MSPALSININREALESELALLQGVVERKTTMPILSHVLLEAAGDSLRLAGTDLDISMVATCPASVSGKGGLAVPAKKLVEIVRSLTAEEIQLAVLDNGWLRISAPGSEFKLAGLTPEDFPNIPVPDAAAPAPLPLAMFQRMISLVVFAMGTEESRFQTTGALLRLTESDLVLASTDGHRMSVATTALPTEAAFPDAMLPRRALQILSRLEDDEGAVLDYSADGQGHFFFRSGARLLVARGHEGTFPDYRRVIPRDHPGVLTVDRAVLLAAASRAGLMTGDRAKAIAFTIGPERLVLSAATHDLGQSREELACEVKGEVRLGVNADYVVQLLSALDCDRVRVEFRDAEAPTLWVPEGESSPKFAHVIAPMKVF